MGGLGFFALSFHLVGRQHTLHSRFVALSANIQLLYLFFWFFIFYLYFCGFPLITN